MIEFGLEWHALDTYMQFKEVSSIDTPPANHVRLAAKDSGGVSTLCYKNDAGTEICLPTSGSIVTGTGVAGRVAFWSSTNVLSSDADLTFSVDTLTATKIITTSLTDSGLTAGRIPFAGVGGLLSDDADLTFATDTLTATKIIAPTSVLIGTSITQVEALDINGTAATVGITLFRAGGSGAGTLLGRQSRGSVASPSASQSGDALLNVSAQGHDGSAFGTGTLIQSFTGSLWSGTNHEGFLTFSTVPNASTTVTERFRIGSAGQWGIGGATYGSSGDIFSSGGASAAPTWVTRATLNAALDHGTLAGLADDDHTQYALLAGRSGGQTLKGGTGTTDNLTLVATSGAGTNAEAIIGKVGNNGGTQFFKAGINYGFFIGNGTTPGSALSVATTGSSFSGGDWIAWFRHENTVAGNESIIRHQHFSGTGIVPQPLFAGLAARGTNASPTGLSADDYLLILDGRGYDGSAVDHGEYAVGFSDTSAQLAMRAGGTWSGTDHESYVTISTTPDASITPSVKLRIAGSGFIAHSSTATVLGAPAASFHAMADGADYSHLWDNYSGTASTSPALIARRARGSFGTPAASQNGDTLFTFQARGHTGSAFTGPLAGIDFLATENHSGTNQGTEIRFTGTTNGTATNFATWKILNTGALQSQVTAARIDLSNIAAGNPNFVITATSDTPTVTWTALGTNPPSAAPAGYLEILVGANTRYIPFWA